MILAQLKCNIGVQFVNIFAYITHIKYVYNLSQLLYITNEERISTHVGMIMANNLEGFELISGISS